MWSYREQSLLLLHSGNFKTAKWQCEAPEAKYWERTAENKVTFVSDWLIDGSHFIVEQPVGHTALNRNLAHTETAVSENAAWCQLWQYLCSHWGRVCVNLCPASPSAGAFLLQTASKLFCKRSAAAEAQHWAALLKKKGKKKKDQNIHINCFLLVRVCVLKCVAATQKKNSKCKL